MALEKPAVYRGQETNYSNFQLIAGILKERWRNESNQRFFCDEGGHLIFSL
jgi:hypothetical protein